MTFFTIFQPAAPDLLFCCLCSGAAALLVLMLQGPFEVAGGGEGDVPTLQQASLVSRSHPMGCKSMLPPCPSNIVGEDRRWLAESQSASNQAAVLTLERSLLSVQASLLQALLVHVECFPRQAALGALTGAGEETAIVISKFLI